MGETKDAKHEGETHAREAMSETRSSFLSLRLTKASKRFFFLLDILGAGASGLGLAAASWERREGQLSWRQMAQGGSSDEP